MSLITVTGEIDPGEVLLADAHEHVWIQPEAGVDPSARIELNDYDAITGELRTLSSGGVLLVDCQPGGAGRDARQLAAVARAANLWITAVTGFHQRKYYPPAAPHWSQTADDFIAELTHATHETRDHAVPVRASAIKVGYEGVIEGQTRVLMEAAAHAARATGATILFHTEQGRGVELLIPFFEGYGVPASQLYLCHVDKRNDFALHADLARAGALLGYDTFARPKYDPANNVWRLLQQMIAAGLDHRVAVGLDFAFPSMWAFGGGQGIAGAYASILKRMEQIGLTADSIRRLTARNIAQQLVFKTAPPSGV